MLKQIPGKIYIESQRGKVAEDNGETYCLFNYKTFMNEHKEPVFPLQYFNETILQAGGKIFLDIAGSACFILPIYNMLEVPADGHLIQLYPGEAIYLKNHSDILCINPHAKESASFMWFIFDNDNVQANASHQKLLIPVDKIKNQWIDLFAGQLNVKIACMSAREELKYFSVSAEKNKLFFFNIAGSFEVCGRLLNQNDGLVLWDCDKADIEALSPDSIMLLLDCQNN